MSVQSIIVLMHVEYNKGHSSLSPWRTVLVSPLPVGARLEHVRHSGSEVHRTHELLLKRLLDGGCCVNQARTFAALEVSASVRHTRQHLWTARTWIIKVQPVGYTNVVSIDHETRMFKGN